METQKEQLENAIAAEGNECFMKRERSVVSDIMERPRRIMTEKRPWIRWLGEH